MRFILSAVGTSLVELAVSSSAFSTSGVRIHLGNGTQTGFLKGGTNIYDLSTQIKTRLCANPQVYLDASVPKQPELGANLPSGMEDWHI